jgi:hypothetical protein
MFVGVRMSETVTFAGVNLNQNLSFYLQCCRIIMQLARLEMMPIPGMNMCTMYGAPVVDTACRA